MRSGIKYGIIAAIVVVVGASAFYLASPLFISTEIDEPLPEGAESPQQLSEQTLEFMSMSEDERIETGTQMSEEEKDRIMQDFSTINNTVDESMSSEMQASQSENVSDGLLLTGSFVGVGDGIHDAEGTAMVIPLENGGSVLRLEDFSVTNGPDLYVYLSTDQSASDFVNLGRLKANIGNQNYEIPAGTDMTKYDMVLIWCRAFSVLFGSSELQGSTA
jgi:hypothetical protein